MFANAMRGVFNIPAAISMAEWSLFALYREAADRNNSPTTFPEAAKSRRIHVALVNIALWLVVLPIYRRGIRFAPDAGWARWGGLAVQTASELLAVRARRYLADNWSGEITIKIDHELIRSGPYRLVRHPIYTGILGMFAGAALVSGEATALAGLAIAGFAYWRKLRLEEARLRRQFGAAWEAYRRQTGLLVPGLTNLRRSSQTT
ncbi:MAG TPA: isoprenylcysteine carboxylmethyltransferase family protein [Bryobacteraceae bacterium]|nr:isoprenylcysteine carboxylmethyltransferase family protein [Bryobacteraceae bacterium]